MDMRYADSSSQRIIALLSNLEGLTAEGLDHILSSKEDGKSQYVDTSDGQSMVSLNNRKTPSSVVTAKRQRASNPK